MQAVNRRLVHWIDEVLKGLDGWNPAYDFQLHDPDSLGFWLLHHTILENQSRLPDSLSDLMLRSDAEFVAEQIQNFQDRAIRIIEMCRLNSNLPEWVEEPIRSANFDPIPITSESFELILETHGWLLELGAHLRDLKQTIIESTDSPKQSEVSTVGQARVFRKIKTGFSVEFNSERRDLGSRVGLKRIHKLLASPNTEFTAEELNDRVRSNVSNYQNDKDDSRIYLNELEQSLKRLNSERESALQDDDTLQIEEINTQLAAIRKDINRRFTKTSILRDQIDSDRENSRDAVSKSIRREYQKMKNREGLPELAAFLEMRIWMGRTFKYSQDPSEPRWET